MWDRASQRRRSFDGAEDLEGSIAMDAGVLDLVQEDDGCRADNRRVGDEERAVWPPDSSSFGTRDAPARP